MRNNDYQDRNKKRLGPLSMLGLFFIGLKVTGNTKMSWFWVLSPFWIPVAVLLLFWAFIGGSILLHNAFGMGPYHPEGFNSEGTISQPQYVQSYQAPPPPVQHCGFLSFCNEGQDSNGNSTGRINN